MKFSGKSQSFHTCAGINMKQIRICYLYFLACLRYSVVMFKLSLVWILTHLLPIILFSSEHPPPCSSVLPLEVLSHSSSRPQAESIAFNFPTFGLFLHEMIHILNPPVNRCRFPCHPTHFREHWLFPCPE